MNEQKLISCYNNKGGVGKTSLSIFLAWALEKTEEVTLIDVDTQQTLTSLVAQHEIGVFPKLAKIKKAIEVSTIDDTFIIADMPPIVTGLSKDLLKISSIVLIPFKPSMMDVISTIKAFQYIRANSKAKVWAVMNMAKSRTKAIEECLQLLSDSEIPTLKTIVYDRIIYADSIGEGRNIYTAGNRSAINEVDQLTKEVLAKLI